MKSYSLSDILDIVMEESSPSPSPTRPEIKQYGTIIITTEDNEYRFDPVKFIVLVDDGEKRRKRYILARVSSYMSEFNCFIGSINGDPILINSFHIRMIRVELGEEVALKPWTPSAE